MATPRPNGRGTPRATAGGLLQLVRSGEGTTRAEIAVLTGLARSTVSQRIDALIDAGYVIEAGEAPSTGGRPPVRLAFNAAAGAVLAADLGATHARLAVTDLDAAPLAEVALDLDIADGPEAVLDEVVHRFDGLLSEAGIDAGQVRGVGIGLPGPVEYEAGRPVNPPIMPGWDGFDVPAHVARVHGRGPVLVDNDVNIMALGEFWSHWRDDVDDLLFIKVGTGIGCGIVAGGQIHRGAQGAAGDLGHIRIPGRDDAICRCGNVGCVEAVAGGGALAAQLRDRGRDAQHSRDVILLVRSGDREATRLVRDGGRALGEVLAAAVNFFNPAVIVIGGDVAQAHEQLLAGIREVVYQRSLPLATRHLRIVRSQLDDRAGVVGAAVMVIERVLDPINIDAALVAEAEAEGAHT